MKADPFHQTFALVLSGRRVHFGGAAPGGVFLTTLRN
jgi:hypothetical protein